MAEVSLCTKGKILFGKLFEFFLINKKIVYFVYEKDIDITVDINILK